MSLATGEHILGMHIFLLDFNALSFCYKESPFSRSAHQGSTPKEGARQGWRADQLN